MNRSVLSLALLLLIVGCTTNKEMDDLALAQSCLDNVPDSNPQQANECFQYTVGFDDPQANSLKCSIMLTAGGLTIDRMTAAYEITQDSTATHGQADYIAFLALTLPDAATGYQNSQTAQTYCNESGDPGLVFVGNLAVIGSLTNTLAGGIDLTGTATAIDGQVQTAISACEVTPLPPQCDPSVVGPAAVTVATNYCASANANQSVCGTLSSTVSQYGSDPNTLTAALMCTLQGKTYDATGPTCT